MSILFSEKYRPSKILEVVGQQSRIKEIINFLKSNKKSALIHGPIGCGKTSAVHAIAKEIGYEIIELNSGDLRDKEKIQQIMGGAVAQKSLFFKKKMIFMDEIDNLNNKDYGGVSEIGSIISQTSFPIIMCANKPFEKKLIELRKKSVLIEFKKLNTNEVVEVLKRICLKENITANDSLLKQIALLSDGDLRAAINDLQASGHTISSVVISKRDQEVSIFTALKQIFKGNSFAVLGALDNVDMDLDEAMLWIDENLPREYSKKELYEAYQALSKADIFKKRIVRQNYWRFLVYVNAMATAGVAFAKEGHNIKQVSYQRATRILKLWLSQSSKKKIIAKKFSGYMHCSSRKLFRELNYIKIICKNEKVKENLVRQLNLNIDETELLLNPKNGSKRYENI